MRRYGLLLAAWITGMLRVALLSVSAQQTPLLRIETEGHSAAARQILFTKDGKTLLSVSKDQTARIWDVVTGQQRVLRFFIGEGGKGQLASAALFEKGTRKILALGESATRSDTACDILLFDPDTGQMMGRMSGHRNSVTGLAFLSDGAQLASSSADGTVRFWDVAGHKQTGKTISHNRGFNETAYVYGLALSPDSAQIATVSDYGDGGKEGALRIWNVADGKQQALWKTALPLHAVDWAKTGTVAFGGRENALYLWHVGQEPEPQRAPPLPDSIECLRFQPDGGLLMVGGGSSGVDTTVRLYSVADRQFTQELKGHRSTVFSTAFAPSGRIGASADASGALLIWNLADGRLRQTLRGIGHGIEQVAWAGDSKRLAWGNRAGETPEFGYDLFRAAPIDNLNPNVPWTLPQTEPKNRSLVLTQDGFGVILRNDASKKTDRITTFEHDDPVRCAVYAPDGRLLIGSDRHLALYTTGKKQPDQQFEGHLGPVRSLAVSPDGRYLASGSDDQFVCIWSLEEKSARVTPLLSLFRSVDGEWIAWTPQGYYNASPRGDRYIGWQVNQGLDKAAVFYDASKFASLFYRPDVIYELFRAGSLPKALVTANQNPVRPPLDNKEHDIVHELDTLKAPNVHIVSLDGQPPKTGWETKNASLRVQVKLAEGGAKEARIHVLVAQRVQPRRLQNLGETDHGVFSDVVTLQPGRNRVVAYATTTQGVRGIAEEVEVIYRPTEGDTTQTRFGTLHLLTVGIGAFEFNQKGNPPDLSLSYPPIDARSIEAFYKAQQGALFDRVSARSLINDSATTARITMELKALLQDVTAHDYVILFVSSHGYGGRETDYHFSFAPFNYTDKPLTVVQWDTILDNLKNAPCPVVVMVDTCYAGGLAIDAYRGFNPQDELLRGAGERGLYALLASSPGEESWEDKTWEHGAFTYGLLQVLKGNRPTLENAKLTFQPRPHDGFFDGTVTFRHVQALLPDIVPRLVEQIGARQHPRFFSPPYGSDDLPMSRTREGAGE